MTLNKADLSLGGGTLMQIATRTNIQMMSYVIVTDSKRLIVIDGGNPRKEDADNLYDIIKQHGGTVDAWFLTHAHEDHIGTVTYMMENHSEYPLDIKSFYYNFPAFDWLMKKEDTDSNKRFFKAVGELKIPHITTATGDIYAFDDVSVEIISHPEDYGELTCINPTSIIMSVHFRTRDVLFLGDFDVDGEDEFFKKRDASKLRCDVVQMAHHGQNGVSRRFYELIKPKLCLYPTPKWLWENNLCLCDDPKTVGKGPFTTPETRRWMDELGTEASFTQADGDWLFY